MKTRKYDQRPSGLRRWAVCSPAVVAALTLSVGAIVTSGDLLPAAAAAPCPDGSNTCAPQPTFDPGPTGGNSGGQNTAPNAPQTTIPPNQDTGAPSIPTNGNPGFQGTVQAMPTPDNVGPESCIAGCPTTQQQVPAPTTAQAPPNTPSLTTSPVGPSIAATVTQGPSAPVASPPSSQSTFTTDKKPDETVTAFKASSCAARDYVMGGVGIFSGAMGMIGGAFTTPLLVGVPVLAGSTAVTAGSTVYVIDCIRNRNN